jgi:phosphopantothenoylcysteine decarboxylase
VASPVDGVQTCVLRAWDFEASKPIVLAPAMNTAMWAHPFTERHLAVLRSLPGVTIVDPVRKELACGDVGTGAMAPVDAIVSALRARF